MMHKPVAGVKRLLSGGILLGCFGLSYWLSRFVMFELHGMKSWPNTLALVGLISIIIAVISSRSVIAIVTIFGYIAGFILSILFNTDGVDQGGGTTNNAWLIWGAVFFVSILSSVIWTFVFTTIHNRKNLHDGKA